MKKQQGFAVLETVLILVVVAIIGFTGWYVWNSRQSTDDTLSQTGNSEVAATGTKSDDTSSSQSSATEQDNQKYITIKDWGVRIPYGTDYNFVYKMETRGSEQTVAITTDKLLAADPGCSLDQPAVGIIMRLKPDNPMGDDMTVAEMAKAGQLHAGHVGQYYYVYSPAQSACSDNETANDLQNDAQVEMNALIKLAEPIKD